jgi:hypothetical protein
VRHERQQILRTYRIAARCYRGESAPAAAAAAWVVVEELLHQGYFNLLGNLLEGTHRRQFKGIVVQNENSLRTNEVDF